jgi:hypothetical protein
MTTINLRTKFVIPAKLPALIVVNSEKSYWVVQRAGCLQIGHAPVAAARRIWIPDTREA